MSKVNEKPIDVEASEITEVSELEGEVAEAISEETKEAKEAKSKNRKEVLKKYGKKALDITIGAVIGFGAAVLTGLALQNKGDDSDDDYEVYEDEDENPNEIGDGQ